MQDESMPIHEVKRKRVQLIVDITDLLNKFQTETSTYVTDIKVEQLGDKIGVWIDVEI